MAPAGDARQGKRVMGIEGFNRFKPAGGCSSVWVAIGRNYFR